jgi:hypothetical protein
LIAAHPMAVEHVKILLKDVRAGGRAKRASEAGERRGRATRASDAGERRGRAKRRGRASEAGERCPSAAGAGHREALA